MCLPPPVRMKRTILPVPISFRRRTMTLDNLRPDHHCPEKKVKLFSYPRFSLVSLFCSIN